MVCIWITSVKTKKQQKGKQSFYKRDIILEDLVSSTTKPRPQNRKVLTQLLSSRYFEEYLMNLQACEK